MAETPKRETWPQWLTLPRHVAQAADYIRWKTQGRVMLVVMIGPGSVAMAKDRDLKPKDAIEILESEIERLRALAGELELTKQTHGFARRT